MNESKVCKKCGEEKPLQQFRKNREWYENICKLCDHSRSIEWQKSNPDKHRQNKKNYYARNRDNILSKIDNRSRLLKQKYSMTIEEYDILLESQNGLCSICSQPETILHRRTGLPISLAVDHCHTSGEIRGLLCRRCNQYLGAMEDNAEWMRKAADYLEKRH